MALLVVVGLVLLALPILVYVWVFPLDAPPGMFRGDWVIEVSNQSGEPVIIRVLANPEIPDSYFVTRVATGSDGPAVAWRGSKDEPVVVLNTACRVLATFTPAGSDTYTAPGVTGVVARVKPWYPFGANYTPGIDGIDDCRPDGQVRSADPSN